MRSVTLFLLTSVFAGACSQLMMKVGMLTLGPLDDVVIDSSSFWSGFPLSSMAWLFMGMMGYLIAILLWIKVLKEYPLSLAYPLLSLGYIVVYAGSVWWPAVNESFSVQKTLGVLLIMVGVVIVAGFSKEPVSSE